MLSFPIHASNIKFLRSYLKLLEAQSEHSFTHQPWFLFYLATHWVQNTCLHDLLPLPTASEVPCALRALVVGCAMLFWLPNLWAHSHICSITESIASTATKGKWICCLHSFSPKYICSQSFPIDTSHVYMPLFSRDILPHFLLEVLHLLLYFLLLI